MTFPTRHAPYVCMLALGALLATQARSQEKQTSPIFEVRSYHIDPERLDEYRNWARQHALDYLRENLNVVGFWVGGDLPAEATGHPLDDLGSANVTWIIEWPSKTARDDRMAEVFSTDEWRDVFSKLPAGRATYLRVESRFQEAM